MAEFCRQCSLMMFGEERTDLAGLSTPAETAAGVYLYALCEGCGMTQVDHTGKCVLTTCLAHHGATRC